MSSYEEVRPLLAACAATDPNAARLLEMFTKADEVLGDYSPKGIGIRKCPACKYPRVSNYFGRADPRSLAKKSL